MDTNLSFNRSLLLYRCECEVGYKMIDKVCIELNLCINESICGNFSICHYIRPGKKELKKKSFLENVHL